MPKTDIDLATSLAMSDHYLSRDELQRWAERIRFGLKPHLQEDDRLKLMGVIKTDPVMGIVRGINKSQEPKRSVVDRLLGRNKQPKRIVPEPTENLGQINVNAADVYEEIKTLRRAVQETRVPDKTLAHAILFMTLQIQWARNRIGSEILPRLNHPFAHGYALGVLTRLLYDWVDVVDVETRRLYSSVYFTTVFGERAGGEFQQEASRLSAACDERFEEGMEKAAADVEGLLSGQGEQGMHLLNYLLAPR